MKKRILVVYPHLPHYRFGVFRLLSLSEKYDFEFAAGKSSPDGSIPCLAQEDIGGYLELHNRWVGPLLWQHGLVGRILSERYDGVIFLGNASYLSTWVGALLGRLVGSKIFFWTIGWHRVDKGLKRYFRNFFYSLANGLMLYGHTGVELGARNGFGGKKLWVVGNSQESKVSGDLLQPEHEFQQFLGRLPKSSSPKVGAVVRLNHVKRLDLLIEAVALLNEQGHEFEILLVGEGPAREELKKRAEQLGVRLFMPGAAYDSRQIKASYELISVTVIPVWAGLSAIQSLMYGRPIVTTDDITQQAPESECIKQGITGMLFEEGSIQSMATCILDCHAMGKSAEEFRSAAKKELDARWTADAHARAIEDALDENFGALRPLLS